MQRAPEERTAHSPLITRPGEPEPNPITGERLQAAEHLPPPADPYPAGRAGDRESSLAKHLSPLYLMPRWAPERGSEELQGGVLAPLVGTDTIYGVSLASPPQAFERLSWQIWAPLAVYIGAEVAFAAFMFRELSVTVVPGDVDASAAAGPAQLSALAMIAVAMIVFLEMVFIFFAFDG